MRNRITNILTVLLSAALLSMCGDSGQDLLDSKVALQQKVENNLERLNSAVVTLVEQVDAAEGETESRLQEKLDVMNDLKADLQKQYQDIPTIDSSQWDAFEMKVNNTIADADSLIKTVDLK